MSGCVYINEKIRQACGAETADKSDYCEFHGSLEARKVNGLKVPMWARIIKPDADDTKLAFYNFPRERYSEYHEYIADSKYIQDCYFECDDFTLNENGISKQCIYQITMGKHASHYCNNLTCMGKNYCPFHLSLIERLHKYKSVVPVWAYCVVPTYDHAKLNIDIFPWKNYGMEEIMNFNVDQTPKMVSIVTSNNKASLPFIPTFALPTLPKSTVQTNFVSLPIIQNPIYPNQSIANNVIPLNPQTPTNIQQNPALIKPMTSSSMIASYTVQPKPGDLKLPMEHIPRKHEILNANSQIDYSKFTVPQLKEECNKLGLRVTSKDRKPQLIAIIEAAKTPEITQ